MQARWIQIAAALLLVLTFGGADKQATWKNLRGVWIGKPVVKAAQNSETDTSGGFLPDQRDASQRLADTVKLKFDFQSRKNVVMTLIRVGHSDDVRRGTWKVVESDTDSLQIEITVRTKDRKQTRLLDITFIGKSKSKFIAVEVKGDVRVGPLVFTRPGGK